MKLIALFLCLCFSLNVLASSGSIQELERSLDEYQFAMTVEWDQRDQNFYDQKTNEFFKAIAEAMSQGVSRDEVIAMVEKKSHNSAMIDALRLKLNLLTAQANSSEELARLLRDHSDQFYQRGASWDGETVLIGGVIVVFAAALAYAIWWNIKYECVQEERYRECDWVTDSHGHSDYRCQTQTRCVEWVERNPQ